MWDPLQWLAQGCLHVLSTKTVLVLPKFPIAYPGTRLQLRACGDCGGAERWWLWGSSQLAWRTYLKYFLKPYMGAVRFSHLIYFLATGLEGLPTPGLPISKEGRWMHGTSATFFSHDSLKNLSCICFPSNIFLRSVIPFNRTHVLIYTVDGD